MVGVEPCRAGELELEFFGTIRPHQTVRPFSLHNHWRTVAVLVLLAALPAGVLVKFMDGNFVKAPVRPAVVLLAKRHRQVARKQPRLRVPVGAIKTAKMNMIEARMDGSLANNTYFSTSIDLSDASPAESQDDQGAVASLAAYGNQNATKPDPFNLILRGERGEGEEGEGHALLHPGPRLVSQPVRGVPINVSVATESPAPSVRRLVAMPAKPQDLSDIGGTLNVSDDEWAALGEKLGIQSLQPGERLEIIYSEADEVTGDSHIILARYVSKRGHEELVARQHNGQCEEIRDRAIYERLLAEALAHHDDEAVVQDTALSVKKSAIAAAKSQYPSVMAHMKREKVPMTVALQVVELLKLNDVHVSDTDDALSKLHVVFRKVESGEVELVFLGIDEGGHERRFYRYPGRLGHDAEFLDESGRSVSKPLIANPVPGSRRNDGFGWRIHPILHRPEFHNGVDFDAPMGSPIVAGGDGVVIKISSEKGYGKYVRVKHDFGYTTTYAHISGTAKGLKVGDRVYQGQVIAFIGSTGLSTGPHLYYELRLGNKYADPTKTKIQAGTVLTGDALSEYHREVVRVNDIAKFVVASAKSVADAVGDGIEKVVQPH
ncbi:murein DD-endopeptidase MepM/ murein hydrolase activator NlpD [Agrobacterium vitis]|nr:murein DD-endopeptidase MepM/ murein hydrolase activator NlpD [Agrobacterium vitis]